MSDLVKLIQPKYRIIRSQPENIYHFSIYQLQMWIPKTWLRKGYWINIEKYFNVADAETKINKLAFKPKINYYYDSLGERM